MNVYESLESAYVAMNSKMKDRADGVEYLTMFLTVESFENAVQPLENALKQGLWISEVTLLQALALMRLLMKFVDECDFADAESEKLSCVEFGKRYHFSIHEMLNVLEENIRGDMAEMYDVKKFLRNKAGHSYLHQFWVMLSPFN